MLSLSGFEIERPIYLGDQTAVYRARRKRDDARVVLKTSVSEQPSAQQVARLVAEFEIGRRVEHPALVRMLELVRSGHRPLLVLEDFDGVELGASLAGGEPLALDRFFAWAERLAAAIAALHAHRVVHRDINPSNILRDPSDDSVKLADLSIASVLERELSRARRPDQIEGTLRYISPEQTGRINRSIDYRTDFYSLGATFYELLAGRAPFGADDPLELVHAHIARKPPPLASLRPDLPPSVCAIVDKLLAKAPEARYQSASGLLADLVRARERLAAGDGSAFELGDDDVQRFAIPERIYGRDGETARLMLALERAAAGGRQLSLVAGDSGIGKSALVAEIATVASEHGALWASGKFDQLQRDIPYAAPLDALGDLLGQLLTLPERELAAWRERLESALEGEAGPLLDALPRLSLLLGPQSAFEPLPPAESERRFARLMRGLVRALAGAEHPLVLVLDDLQWADAASLTLLERLLGDDALAHLLVIGTYRSDEVGPTHPLSLCRESLARAGVTADEIALGPIGEHDIAALLGDAMRCPLEATRPLAALIWRKSVGNPFFVEQLIGELYRRGLLELDEAARAWRCDIRAIEQLGIADDVAELLLERMKRLDARTKELLELGACIGARFDLRTLSVIANDDPLRTRAAIGWSIEGVEAPAWQGARRSHTGAYGDDEQRRQAGWIGAVNEQAIAARVPSIARALRPAVDAGILRPLGSGYSRLVARGEAMQPDVDLERESAADANAVLLELTHDRFQQAAYESIPEERRAALHLELARLLDGSGAVDSDDDALFAVTAQYNDGITLVRDEHERARVAELNRLAGERAKRSAAWDTARRHLLIAIGLLPATRWSTEDEQSYERVFELCMSLYDCLMATARNDEAEALAHTLLDNARSLVHRARALSPFIITLCNQKRPEEALQLGTAMLDELGIDLGAADIDAALSREREHIRALIGERDVSTLASLEELPRTHDPRVLATVDLLRNMVAPTYMRDRERAPLSVALTVRQILQHGRSPFAGLAFAGYSHICAHDFGEYRFGYQLAQLGKRLADEEGVVRCSAHFNATALCEWVVDPLSLVAERLRRVFRIGVEGGETIFASLCASALSSHAFASGAPMQPLREENGPLLEYIVRYMGDIGVREIDLTNRAIAALRGETPWRSALFESDAEEQRALETMQLRNAEGVMWYRLLAARLALLFGDHERAAEMAHAGRQIRRVGFAHYSLYALIIVEALARARQAPGLGAAPGGIAVLDEAITATQALDDAGGGLNYRHDLLLLRAEAERLRGDFGEAATLYQQSIDAANALGQNDAEGLAAQCCGELYAELGLAAVAELYYRRARYAYERWGALALVARLDARLPSEASAATSAHVAARRRLSTEVTRTSLVDTATELDMAAISKASQAISSEVRLDGLLRRLLAIALQGAGAERAVLVLSRGDEQMVVAASSDDAQPRTLDAAPLLAQSDELSAGVVNYVARTREALVLEDPALRGMFRADPYIKQHAPRSVLATPLINASMPRESQLAGVLYLENEQTSAFSEARLQTVQLLAAQAAISLTNARLYAELEESNRTLERKVAERTRDLALKNEALEASLAQVEEMQGQLLLSEKMASLGNLVAGVAHEINTPIGAVITSADTSQRALDKLQGRVDEAATLDELRTRRAAPRLIALLRDNQRVILDAGQRVDAIVRNLRSFARLDEAECKPVDLHEGFDSTVELARHRLSERVTLERDYGELPRVNCRPNQINQVLMNLLLNGIDAIEREPGRTGSVRIRTWRVDEDRVAVSVGDDGVGIPDENRRRIFEPGFSTKGGLGVGTGLGLPTCLSIIRNHGGTLAVQSAVGSGSTVTFELPISGPV